MVILIFWSKSNQTELYWKGINTGLPDSYDRVARLAFFTCFPHILNLIYTVHMLFDYMTSGTCFQEAGVIRTYLEGSRKNVARSVQQCCQIWVLNISLNISHAKI